MAKTRVDVPQQLWKLLLLLVLTFSATTRARPDALLPTLIEQVKSPSEVPEESAPSQLLLDVRGSPDGTPLRDFVAAVYEFAAVPWNGSLPQPWAENLVTAQRQAAAAAAQGADILVLAEYGISGGVSDFPLELDGLLTFAQQLPSLDKPITPCGDSLQSSVFSTLSCMARDNQIYVVVNIIEKEPCGNATLGHHDPCPALGYFLYNTNLVFDRNGTFIQKYRKVNLYHKEHMVLHTPAPQLAAFRTDFGVTFGLMTCFDILFEVPAVELTRRGVTHFVFPTLWSDELPSLAGLQMHTAWARGLNVTLLSSGHHNLARSSLGSGIYTGSGITNYTYDYTTTEGRLVTAQVPAGKRLLAEEVSLQDSLVARNTSRGSNDLHVDYAKPVEGYYPIKHYNISEYSSALFTGKTQRLCHGDFCCHVKVTAKENKVIPGNANAPAYRLLVYRGHRSFSPRWATEICSVVLCADSTQQTCNVFPSASSAQLPLFELSGSFSSGTLVFPSVILQQMRPTTEWEYHRSERYISLGNTSGLLTAQLYGRNYASDLP